MVAAAEGLTTSLGRTVTMPCVVRDASAGTAMFDVAARRRPGDAARAPSTSSSPSPGRCQLIIAVIDYRDNDLGDYLEVGLTFFVTPRGAGPDAAGTFITRLPVDQEFTCEAGRADLGVPQVRRGDRPRLRRRAPSPPRCAWTASSCCG